MKWHYFVISFLPNCFSETESTKAAKKTWKICALEKKKHNETKSLSLSLPHPGQYDYLFFFLENFSVKKNVNSECIEYFMSVTVL